jgi:hypothetical protein
MWGSNAAVNQLARVVIFTELKPVRVESLKKRLTVAVTLGGPERE